MDNYDLIVIGTGTAAQVVSCVKQESSALMHLKSYQVGGHVLRTGAANFSASGLKREGDDLIVIESAEAAMAFKRNFEARFASGDDFLAERK